MQSLHDYCYEETTANMIEHQSDINMTEHRPATKNHLSLLYAFVNTSAKLVIEIITMLSIFATGAMLTLISAAAPVLFFL